MARANPRLPRSIRTRMAKMPDYKVAQYVKGSPRFKLGERRDVLQGAMRTPYMREEVKEAIRKARQGGLAISHEDEDVRHFLRNYGSENQLSPEGMRKWLEGAEKFLSKYRTFKYRYTVRPGHLEEDARVKAKLLAREATTAKKQEMLDEARVKLAMKQRRADLRDPVKRAEIFRPGMAKPMGSSVVQKESNPQGYASVFDYKPGSAPGETPNPANVGTPNPTGPANPIPPANPTGGPVANPAGASPAAPLPLAGFRGLAHEPGHELPGEVGGLSHAPSASQLPSAGPSSAPAGSTPSPHASEPAEPQPEAPSAPPPEEPPDMEIG